MSDKLEDATDTAQSAWNGLLAFDVRIDDMHCICFAMSAPKARWMAVHGYWDAGFGRRGLWPRAVATRKPEYDNSPIRKMGKGKCWVPEYVENYHG